MSDLYARERAEHFLASRDDRHPDDLPRHMERSRYQSDDRPDAADLAADERGD
jgi:hypothetical protein